MSTRTSWHDDVFFGIHYDLHARETDTVLGKELTHENLRTELKKVDPDWIQCDCKGHPGWASWPSKTGPTSPGVVRDSLQIHRDVCKELGIPLGMHYSGVIDAEQVARHPGWAQMDADGARAERTTCRLSPYLREFMIPQMLELIDTYDVDGFWVDGDNWATGLCYCERCQDEFRRRTGIARAPASEKSSNWDAWTAFHRELFVEYVTAYTRAVHERKPDCASCSNWMYSMRMPEPVQAPIDYISGDYMANFGMYRASLEARFISSRGLSWDLMCWGFTRDTSGTGAASVWKTEIHLCQEVTEVLAHGGAVMVYAKPQRTGHLVGWHHDILARVAGFCRARKPFCFKTESASDATILHLPGHYYRENDPCFNYGNAVAPLEGALHVLLENGISTDLINEADAIRRMGRYGLVVVPEQTHLSPELVEALESYASHGGTLVMSGAHLAEEVPALVGVRKAGKELEWEETVHPWGNVFLETGGEAVGVKVPWAHVACTTSETRMTAMRANDPVRDRTEIPAVTVRRVGKGRILAIHGPLFRDYFRGHNPRLRTLLATLLNDLPVDWRVRVQAPPQVEVVARTHDGAMRVNLINKGVSEMTYSERPIVTGVPPVGNIRLSVRLESAPVDVRLQPEDKPLDVEWDPKKSRARITVPELHIHSVVTFS